MYYTSRETKMIPAMFPSAAIVPKVPGGRRLTVGSVCRLAGVECRATGPTAERRVYVRRADALEVSREPGCYGAVSVGVPRKKSPREEYLLVLAVLAYVVHDYAARESAAGLPEMRVSAPRGRPRKAHPMTGAERQRRWRLLHRGGKRS
jgi:hypothetical protein